MEIVDWQQKLLKPAQSVTTDQRCTRPSVWIFPEFVQCVLMSELVARGTQPASARDSLCWTQA